MLLSAVLAFPKSTLAMMYAFLILRMWHINGYFSVRGHNRAFAAGDCSKLTLVLFIGIGFCGSFKLLGLW